MGLLDNTLKKTAEIFYSVTFMNYATKLSCAFHEALNPIYTSKRKGITYKIFCPNNLVRYRAETYFTKEPETIEWLDTFQKGDILFDIGANIGLYSIYAAKNDIEVISFEPESQNYALLNKNIYINNLSHKITALNIGLSDNNSITELFIPYFQTGGALNNIGEARDWEKKSFKADFQQGALIFSLDSFLDLHPEKFPTHLKIDVDGIEAKIIAGSKKTLQDSRLKSLSIELNENLDEDKQIIKHLQQAGLIFKHKKRAEMFEDSIFSNVYNFLFVRE